jgi:hypothetical protein
MQIHTAAVQNLRENVPFSFTDEEHAAIHMCFIRKVFLLLRNAGDDSQSKASHTGSIVFIFHYQVLERETLPSLPVKYAVR